MKKIVLIILLAFLSGCATISVDGISYTRFFDQQIHGLDFKKVNKDGDIITLKIEKQSARGDVLKDLLEIIKKMQ